ncbi:MAG: cysteine hydrolase [Chloroflexi bacterium]|nr:cysteine hydrolase [Chloroflexota bacterium]
MSWQAEQHDTEWPFEYHATPFDLNPDSTALLVVDMQAGDLVKDTRVVYTRNGAITPHGEEVIARLKSRKKRGTDIASERYRGAPEYEIAAEVFPTPDELVVDKLTSSAFHNTMVDHALRNFGITDVVITGVLTDMCILGTARVAAELGYNTLIAEDACGTLTQRAHDEALLMHARVFGRVATTADVIAELSARARGNQ